MQHCKNKAGGEGAGNRYIMIVQPATRPSDAYSKILALTVPSWVRLLLNLKVSHPISACSVDVRFHVIVGSFYFFGLMLLDKFISFFPTSLF